MFVSTQYFIEVSAAAVTRTCKNGTVCRSKAVWMNQNQHAICQNWFRCSSRHLIPNYVVELQSDALLKGQANDTVNQQLLTNFMIVTHVKHQIQNHTFFPFFISKENKNRRAYWQENWACKGSDRLKSWLELTSLLNRADKNMLNLYHSSNNPSNHKLCGASFLFCLCPLAEHLSLMNTILSATCEYHYD